jgi:glycosyltransferase involved in cell wall biosynthesis
MQTISPAINIIAKEKLTKLIIQINCFNEADNLAEAVRDLPRKIDGIDIIEVLVVDDGSKDNTADVAAAAGVHHIVRHYGNKGLPSAVNTGVREAIKLNADILVNTDADRQYKGEDIAKLVKPIVEKGADFVYGQRMIDSIEHFSVAKKFLQKFGARVVTAASGCRVDDAASGFRAINKHAMQPSSCFLITLLP